MDGESADSTASRLLKDFFSLPQPKVAPTGSAPRIVEFIAKDNLSQEPPDNGPDIEQWPLPWLSA